jgi:hypothetical protein
VLVLVEEKKQLEVEKTSLQSLTTENAENEKQLAELRVKSQKDL